MPDKEITLHFQVDAQQAKSELAALAQRANAIGQPGAEGNTQNAQQGGPDGNKAGVDAWRASMESAKEALGDVVQLLGEMNTAMEENSKESLGVAEAYTTCSAAFEALGNAITALNGQDNSALVAAFEKLVPTLQAAHDALAAIDVSAVARSWIDLGDSVRYSAENFERFRAAVEADSFGDLPKKAEEMKDGLDAEAAAAERSSESTEKKAKVDVEAAYTNKLLQMSLAELREEYMRLEAARKAAAKAGDVKQLDELNAKQAAVAKQLRSATKALNISKLEMFGQAQAAAMAADSIKRLSEGVLNFGDALKNGQIDLTSMLGNLQTLKATFAGMTGPIGIAMLAVQGLTMAWNAYAKEQQKAIENEKELKKLEDARRSKRIEDNLKIIAEERKAEVARTTERVNGYAKATQKQLEEDKEAARQRVADAKAEEEEKRRHKRKLLEEEMAVADETRKKELRKELADLDEKARVEQVRLAENEAKAAKTRVQQMERELASAELQNYLKIRLPDREEYNRLLAQIAVEENKSATERNGVLLKELRDRKIELDAARFQLVNDVKAIDKTFMGGVDAAIDLVSGIQAGAKETEKALDAYKKEASQAERAAEATRKKADNARQEERQSKARVEANEQLDAELKRIGRETKTIGTYSLQDRRAQYDIMLADRRILRDKLRRLRAARADADGLADRGKVEALNREIDAVSKSLKGASQKIDESVPEMVQALRDGLTPKKGAVALNPENQEAVNNAFIAMAKRGKEMEELLRRQADAQRRAMAGDGLAWDELEQVNEQIVKTRKRIAATAEDIDKRVVGGTAGADYQKELDANLSAAAKAYGVVARVAEQKAAAAQAETRRPKRAQRENDATPEELRERVQELGSANKELKRINEQLKEFSADVVSGLNGLYSATLTITNTLAGLKAELAGLKGSVKSLQGRLGKVAGRNA